MILKHYLMRTIKDPINLLMLILFPVAMITIFTATGRTDIDEAFRLTDQGFCIIATGNTFFNMMFFQYFGGMIVTDYLYNEFKTDMRWRLMATPKPFSKFVISAIMASLIISAVNGAIVLAYARFVLNAQLYNLPMIIGTLALMATFVTLFGVLCFLVIPKKGTTTAVIMSFAFAQMLILNFGLLPNPGIDAVGISSFFPVVAAVRAIDHVNYTIAEFTNPDLGFIGGWTVADNNMTMALTHLGILAGLTIVTGIAVLILGKVRKI